MLIARKLVIARNWKRGGEKGERLEWNGMEMGNGSKTKFEHVRYLLISLVTLTVCELVD